MLHDQSSNQYQSMHTTARLCNTGMHDCVVMIHGRCSGTVYIWLQLSLPCFLLLLFLFLLLLLLLYVSNVHHSVTYSATRLPPLPMKARLMHNPTSHVVATVPSPHCRVIESLVVDTSHVGISHDTQHKNAQQFLAAQHAGRAREQVLQ